MELIFYPENPKIKDAKRFSFICETADINKITKLVIEQVIVFTKDKKITKDQALDALMLFKEELGLEYKIHECSLSQYEREHDITIAKLLESAPTVLFKKVYFVYE